MNAFRYKISSFTRGVRFRLTRRLNTRAVAEVWPGIESTVVGLMPFAGRFGNVTKQELMSLCAVATFTNARTIFEFGTFDGLTTWHLARNSAAGSRILTLDLPLEHPARRSVRHDRGVGRIHGVPLGCHFAGTPEAARIEQLFCDSLEFDAQPYRGLVDFVFIDASHEYKHVCKDSENALAMTRPGGVIFWHDYSRWWPGVQKCLEDLSARTEVFRLADTSLAALRV
jgi:predicted O-methyltransferase YrrM